MKVKVFDEAYPELLEKALNKFLEDNPSVLVIDIKYAISIVDNDENYFTALLLYKEGK